MLLPHRQPFTIQLAWLSVSVSVSLSLTWTLLPVLPALVMLKVPTHLPPPAPKLYTRQRSVVRNPTFLERKGRPELAWDCTLTVLTGVLGHL